LRNVSAVVPNRAACTPPVEIDSRIGDGVGSGFGPQGDGSLWLQEEIGESVGCACFVAQDPAVERLCFGAFVFKDDFFASCVVAVRVVDDGTDAHVGAIHLQNAGEIGEELLAAEGADVELIPHALEVGVVGAGNVWILDEEGVFTVAAIACACPVERAGDGAGAGGVGVDDHILVVHFAERVLAFDEHARLAQEVVARKGVARAELIPQAAHLHAAFARGDEGVGKVVVSEEEDGKVDAGCGLVDLFDHGSDHIFGGRKGDLQRIAVIGEGGGQRIGFGGAKEARPHLVEVSLVVVGEFGAFKKQGVVVIFCEAIVRHICGAGPEIFAVDDEVFVVHDAAEAFVVLNDDVGGVEAFEKRAIGLVFVMSFVIGHNTHDDATFFGGDKCVADAGAVKVVEGGVDGNAGAVDAVEQCLLHGRDKFTGAIACHVVGEEDDGVKLLGACGGWGGEQEYGDDECGDDEAGCWFIHFVDYLFLSFRKYIDKGI